MAQPLKIYIGLVDVTQFVSIWPVEVTKDTDGNGADLKLTIRELVHTPNPPAGVKDLTDILPGGPAINQDVFFAVETGPETWPIIYFGGRIKASQVTQDVDNGRIWQLSCVSYVEDLNVHVGSLYIPAGPVTWGADTFDCTKDHERIRYILRRFLPSWHYSINPYIQATNVTYTTPVNYYKTTVAEMIRDIAAYPGSNPLSPVVPRNWFVGNDSWGGGGKYLAWYLREGISAGPVGLTTGTPSSSQVQITNAAHRVQDASQLINCLVIRGLGGEDEEAKWDGDYNVNVSDHGSILIKDDGTNNVYDAGSWMEQYITSEGGYMVGQIRGPQGTPTNSTWNAGQSVNVSTSAGSITKNAGADNAWNAGGFGDIVVTDDLGGAVQGKLHAGKIVAFGLSQINSGTNWNTIKLGIRVNAGNTFTPIRSGAEYGSFPYLENDLVRSRVTPAAPGQWLWEVHQSSGGGSWILRHSLTVTAATVSGDMYVDASIYTLNAVIDELKVTVEVPTARNATFGFDTAKLATNPNTLDIAAQVRTDGNLYILRNGVVLDDFPIDEDDFIKIDVSPNSAGEIVAEVFIAPSNAPSLWTSMFVTTLTGQTFPMYMAGMISTLNATLENMYYRRHSYSVFRREDSIGAPWNLGEMWAAQIHHDDDLDTVAKRQDRANMIFNSLAYPRDTYVCETRGIKNDGTYWQFEPGVIVPIVDPALLGGGTHNRAVAAVTTSWQNGHRIQRLECGDRFVEQGDQHLYIVSVTAPDTQAPPIPTGLNIISQGYDGHQGVAITVGWSRTTGDEQWIDLRVTRQNPSEQFTHRVSSARTTATIEGLAENSLYWIQIAAIDYNGRRSMYSASVFFTTIQLTPPTPYDFTRTGRVGYRDDYHGWVEFSWAQPSWNGVIVGYQIRWAPTGDAFLENIVDIPTPYTLGIADWVQTNVQYTFQVRTIGVGNFYSDWSNSVTYTLPARPKPVPPPPWDGLPPVTDSLYGWTKTGIGDITISSEQAHQGNSSYKVTPSPTEIITMMSDPIVCKPLEDFSLRVFYYGPGANMKVGIGVAFYDKGDGLLSTTTILSSVATTTATWVEVFKKFVTPADAVTAKIVLQTENISGTDSVFWSIDRMMQVIRTIEIGDSQVIPSKILFGVMGAVYNGSMEVPNSKGDGPDAWAWTGNVTYPLDTGQNDGVRALHMGGAVTTYTIWSPHIFWTSDPVDGNGLVFRWAQNVSYLSTAPVGSVKLQPLDKDHGPIGSLLTLRDFTTGTTYTTTFATGEPIAYIRGDDLPAQTVYVQVVWQLVADETTEHVYIDSFESEPVNDLTVAVLYWISDQYGQKKGFLGHGINGVHLESLVAGQPIFLRTPSSVQAITIGGATTDAVVKLESSGTIPTFNVPRFSGDPSTLVNGDLWITSIAGVVELRVQDGGAAKTIASSAGMTGLDVEVNGSAIGSRPTLNVKSVTAETDLVGVDTGTKIEVTVGLPNNVSIAGTFNSVGETTPGAPVNWNRTLVTSSTTLGAHVLVDADATSANVVLTLPLAASVPAGRWYRIVRLNNNLNTVSLATSGSDILNGQANVPLGARYDSMMVHSNGVSSWYGTFVPGAFVRALASSATLSTERVVTADASLGNVTLTIPDAATVPPGHWYWITRLNTGANTVTLQRSGTNIINGATSFTLNNRYDSVLLYGNGVGAWYAIYIPGVLTGTMSALTVRKNGTTTIGSRPQLNFAEGSNISIGASDDGTEIDVSFSVSSNPSFTGVSVAGAIAMAGGQFLGMGTSNPGSPTTNDLYFRTDLGLWIYYDGANWLTEPYPLVGTYGLQSTIANTWSANAVTLYFKPPNDYAGVVRRVEISYVIDGATHDSSNYWKFLVWRYRSGAGWQQIDDGHWFTDQATVSDDTNFVADDGSMTSDRYLDIAQNYVRIDVEKVGSPSNIGFSGCSIYVSKIIT